jgi:hypothetical protein
MTDFYSLSAATSPMDHADTEQAILGSPDDVLMDSRLTTGEKRCLLASLASDANAVPHLPSLRQLPDGSIVRVDEILHALKALDAAVDADHAKPRFILPLGQAFKRRWRSRPRHWTRHGRWPPDDDDPPPCPAFAALRPKGGGGAGAAEPDLASAC